MPVMSVISLRPRDGKVSEVLETLKTVKSIVERNGGKFRVVRQVFGPNPATIAAISEFPDLSGLAKFQSDSQMQQLITRVRNNPSPPADPIAAIVAEELPI